jgi:hypothetical protein
MASKQLQKQKLLPLLQLPAHRKGCWGSFHTDRAPTSTSSSDAVLSVMTFFTAGPQRTQSGHHETPVTGSGSAMNST